MTQANNTVPDSIPNEARLPISTNTHAESFARDSDNQEPSPPNNSSKYTLRLHNIAQSMDQNSKFRSEAWNYFQVIDGRAICKLCNKPYVYSQGSTSNLLRHAKSHQVAASLPQNPNTMKNIRPKEKTPTDKAVDTAQLTQKQEEITPEPKSLPQSQQFSPAQLPKNPVSTYTPPVSKQVPVSQSNVAGLSGYKPSYTPPGATGVSAPSSSEPSAKRSKVQSHYPDLEPPTHQLQLPPQSIKPPAVQRPIQQMVHSVKDEPAATRSEDYDEESFRNDLVNLFLNNNLSFDLIESPDFITIFQKLTPHKLCSSTMMKLLVLTKLQLQGKELFENLGKKH